MSFFFVPSLQLVRQTLEEWSIQTKNCFSYLYVCSDQTIDSSVDQNNISLDEIDIPVTTDFESICAYLSKQSDLETVYIFSTYQSAKEVGKALQNLPDFMFDWLFSVLLSLE